MLKRLVSLSLILFIMFLSIPHISIFAAYQETLRVGFEDGEASVVYDNHYNKVDSTNGLLVGTNLRWYANVMSIEENMGYGGGAALYVKCDDDANLAKKDGVGYYLRGASTKTKAVNFGEEYTSILKYKLRIDDYPTANLKYTADLMRMAAITAVDSSAVYSSDTGFSLQYKSGTGAYFVTNANTSKTLPCEKEKWYTFVMKYSDGGINSSTNKREVIWEGYIVSEDGKVLLELPEIKTSPSQMTTDLTQVEFWPVNTMDIIAGKDENKLTYRVDDISLTTYKNTDKVSLCFFDSNIQQNETEVAINKSFNIAFDQEIAAVESGDVLLYKTNDSSKTPVSITVSNETFDGFTVKPDTNLDPNTSYTLDFSGITNSQGVAIDDTKTITFTTVDPNEVPVKLESAKTSSGREFAGGLTGVVLDESFVLNFDSAIITPVANTDIKMYLNNAEKTEVSVDVKLSNDKKSVTITPAATLSLATGYVIDFSGVLSDTYGEIEGTSSLSFTTLARREMLYYADDMESANIGALSNYESDVFSVASSPVLSVEEKAGYNNSKGIRINSVKKGEGITTKSYPLDASERVVFEYKINVSSVSSDAGALKNVGIVYVNDVNYNNTLLEIRTDKYGYARIGSYSTSYPYYFRMNTWHTIVCEISKTAQSIYMFDEKGKIVYDYTYSGGKARTIGDTVSLYPIFGTGNGTINAVIDDVKVYRLSDHELGLLETKSDIAADGMTNFIADDTITLAFNQPLNSVNKDVADTFELWENGTKVSAKAKKLDANTIVIIPEKMLKDSTEYTVKIPALSALSGNSAENAKEIKFTTKNLYSVKATEASLDISGGILNKGTATLSIQNNGGAINDAVIVAAIYDGGRPGRLIKIKVFENMDIAAGANTKSLEFNEDIYGVGSVEFFLYNSITSPKPLMRSYKVIR